MSLCGQLLQLVMEQQSSPPSSSPSHPGSLLPSQRAAADLCGTLQVHGHRWGPPSKYVGTAGPSKPPQCSLCPGSRVVGLSLGQPAWAALALCWSPLVAWGGEDVACVLAVGEGAGKVGSCHIPPSPSPSSSARPCQGHAEAFAAGRRGSLPTRVAVPWLHPEHQPGLLLAQAGDLSRRPAAAPGLAPACSGAGFEQGPFPSAAETFLPCQVPSHELHILRG